MSRPLSPSSNSSVAGSSSSSSAKVSSFPSVTTQSIHYHISRSLPTSRRNSTDLTSLWSSLDSLNLNPRPAGDVRRKENEGELIPHHLRRVSSNDTVCVEKSFSTLIPPQFSDRFMFEDDRHGSNNGSRDIGNFESSLSSTAIDDSFMIFRREAFPGLLSARSAALDLATLPQTSPRSSARVAELNSIYGGQKFGDRFQRQISPPDFAPTKSVNNTHNLSSVQETAFRHQLPQQQQQHQQRPTPPPQQQPLNNTSAVSATSIAPVPPPPQLASSLSSSSSSSSIATSSSSSSNAAAVSSHPMEPHNQAYNTVTGSLTFPHIIEHQQQSMMSMPNNVCRYYIQGYCSRGERCSFAHPPPVVNHLEGGTFFNVASSPSSTSLPSSSANNISNTFHSYPPNPQMLRSQSSGGVGAAGVGGGSMNNANMLMNHQGGGAIFPSGMSPAVQYPNSVTGGVYMYNSFPGSAVGGSGGGGAIPKHTMNMNGDVYMAALHHNHHQLQLQQHQQQQQQQHQVLQLQQQSQQPKMKRSVSDEANRFSAIPFEELLGQLYSLCKDQHGCRYLQKKLEERCETQLNAIFLEVFPHFVELMTDPFGNYLCQRLLEYCTEEQRTAIAESVGNDLVHISLNMHGTRAVQKMIEYLSNAHQIRALILALSMNVVTLIKDLNGNHVIQKCLNRLTCEQNQFIYNAVTQHCVEVATHRHGCCVLQRCIDHASESQKQQLVAEITFHALPLVQDPFGNYVVQYVLDLNDGIYADGVIRRFIGNVCILSVQKFSSNVIEKCIRVAKVDTRKYLIEELLNRDRLDKLIKDSFANYVVQTAIDFSDPLQRMQLVECIRPLLASIRNTPHGKRIYNKINREHPLSTNNICTHFERLGFTPSYPPYHN